ncbi:hypothetical protein EIN_146180 [Entamoeba invadens IP1]|uniref:Uncharacterized protein n=1 Tax=Entamoeba invadens IP1 TaxID=370355 RepID=L7FNA8_ENTIV|nr:hypothetical protein EIN_146180 [Entamoeba invadens IP1]ELP87624.1 hypothetical protein EIN_146180 [Entamoeba invadens IP1]|eukprot:XP_004254395.1 hypothetical protein EIN_146180 [Entamoeba invadens IP1]
MSTSQSFLSSDSIPSYIKFECPTQNTEKENYSHQCWENDSSSTLANPVSPEYIVFPIDDADFTLRNDTKTLRDTEDWIIHLQMTDKKKDKLTRLTGRRNSIEKISPFLISETSEQAKANGSLVLKSDTIKQKTGERPDPCFLRKVRRSGNRYDHVRIDKMRKIFGRRDSIVVISNLVVASTSQEAMQNAIKIRRVEKLKKLAGL